VVGAFVRYGEYIGTIRYLPMNEGLAPCDALVRRHGVADELLDASWEVGRLVLDPRYRSSPEALKRCLLLPLVHLMKQMPVVNVFASCTPVLSRLYRRFGFSVLVKDAAQDAEGSYSLIHGRTPDMLRALVAGDAEKRMAEEILAMQEASMVLPC
jgi:hypothetical protein